MVSLNGLTTVFATGWLNKEINNAKSDLRYIQKVLAQRQSLFRCYAAVIKSCLKSLQYPIC